MTALRRLMRWLGFYPGDTPASELRQVPWPAPPPRTIDRYGELLPNHPLYRGSTLPPGGDAVPIGVEATLGHGGDCVCLTCDRGGDSRLWALGHRDKRPVLPRLGTFRPSKVRQ